MTSLMYHNLTSCFDQDPFGQQILAAALPTEGEESVSDELNAPEYSTDEFRMFQFKVERCGKRCVHDWRCCPFAHPTENARRRDPRLVEYLPVPCPDYKRGICLRGDACPYSHGVYECWLHPAKYRTQLCKEGPACRRPVCFFAHAVRDLRQPTHTPGEGSGPRATLQCAAAGFRGGSGPNSAAHALQRASADGPAPGLGPGAPHPVPGPAPSAASFLRAAAPPRGAAGSPPRALSMDAGAWATEGARAAPGPAPRACPAPADPAVAGADAASRLLTPRPPRSPLQAVPAFACSPAPGKPRPAVLAPVTPEPFRGPAGGAPASPTLGVELPRMSNAVARKLGLAPRRPSRDGGPAGASGPGCGGLGGTPPSAGKSPSRGAGRSARPSFESGAAPAHATIRAAYNPRAASLDSPFGAPAPAEGALGIHPALLSLIDSGLGGSAFAPAAVASAGASPDSASLSALLAGLGSCSLDGSGGAPGPRHGHDQPPLESFALFSSATSGGFLGPAGGAAWGPPAQTQAAGAASRAASFDTAFLSKQQATAQQDRVFFDARNGVPRHSAEFGRTACLF
ncbi:hypothetical protein ACKKBG_A16060 [Auxenochlorella protothecoides x Auxenochlorella symbiontica]